MRVSGWQLALAEECRAAQRRTFRWGRHDCCLFAARCFEALTGENRRGRFVAYRNKAEAEQILETFGGMRGLLVHAFGEPKPVAFAAAGDIVEIDMGRGPQPAVCRGVNCYAPGLRGLVIRPTALATAAWTV